MRNCFVPFDNSCSASSRSEELTLPFRVAFMIMGWLTDALVFCWIDTVVAGVYLDLKRISQILFIYYFLINPATSFIYL